jgi:hypothetical protein
MGGGEVSHRSFLSFSARWSWVANMTLRHLYPQERTLGDGRTQEPVWSFSKTTGIRPPARPARSLVAIPTELSQVLLSHNAFGYKTSREVSLDDLTE